MYVRGLENKSGLIQIAKLLIQLRQKKKDSSPTSKSCVSQSWMAQMMTSLPFEPTCK